MRLIIVISRHDLVARFLWKVAKSAASRTKEKRVNGNGGRIAVAQTPRGVEIVQSEIQSNSANEETIRNAVQYRNNVKVKRAIGYFLRYPALPNNERLSLDWIRYWFDSPIARHCCVASVYLAWKERLAFMQITPCLTVVACRSIKRANRFEERTWLLVFFFLLFYLTFDSLSASQKSWGRHFLLREW